MFSCNYIDCSESIPEAPAGSDTASGYGGELGTRMGPLTLGAGTPACKKQFRY